MIDGQEEECAHYSRVARQHQPKSPGIFRNPFVELTHRNLHRPDNDGSAPNHERRSSVTAASGSGRRRPRTEKETHGEFESEHPGYCGAQDTFYVGNMK